jgi:hypothetical protein
VYLRVFECVFLYSFTCSHEATLLLLRHVIIGDASTHQDMMQEILQETCIVELKTLLEMHQITWSSHHQAYLLFSTCSTCISGSGRHHDQY